MVKGWGRTFCKFKMIPTHKEKSPEEEERWSIVRVHHKYLRRVNPELLMQFAFGLSGRCGHLDEDASTYLPLHPLHHHHPSISSSFLTHSPLTTTTTNRSLNCQSWFHLSLRINPLCFFAFSCNPSIKLQPGPFITNRKPHYLALS